MWSDSNSSEDEEKNVGPMCGQVTEKNPNYEKKEKCGCRKGCSKRSCSCYRLGNGCNSSCGCKSSCENMFNHLHYFFGDDHKTSANPCFSNWLIKNAKNADGLQKIDRDALREKIQGCS